MFTRTRFGQLVDPQQGLLNVGHFGKVDGVGDVPTVELVVETTVDDEEPLDSFGVVTGLQLVELLARVSSFVFERATLERNVQ